MYTKGDRVHFDFLDTMLTQFIQSVKNGLRSISSMGDQSTACATQVTELNTWHGRNQRRYQSLTE